jgi:proline iminopeptidase
MANLIPGEYDVVLNNVRCHYTVRGSGPPLIAISGGPGMDARGWDDFAAIDEFVTIIALHPRGSGLSDLAADNAYRLADFAADVEALRQHLALEKPAVMGWSHGGMVAQQFAFTYPSSLSRLILFDTSAHFGEFLSDIDAAVQEFKNQPWFEKSYQALQKEWAGEYHSDEDMGKLWAEEMKFYFKNFDRRAQAYHRRTKDLPIRIASLHAFNENEAASMDLRPQLKEIRVPTLVIVGRHDFITNVAMAQEMANHIPDSQLVIFEDSGHFALVEEPHKFYQTIQKFILESNA